MGDDAEPIARVRLARSLSRLLARPLIAALAIGALATAAVLALGEANRMAAIVVIAVAGLLLAVTLGAAAVLLSVRLDVEEAALRLHWIGGERRYPLARGAVTRVTVRGPNASSLRGPLRALGLGIGHGRLRGEEPVELIVLAPVRTVILVPTERGRLAIAAHDETELLDALSRAAQARRRLDELVRGMAAPPQPAEPPVEPPPRRELTGIERALLEEQLAAEQAAAARLPDDVDRPPTAGLEAAAREVAPPSAMAAVVSEPDAAAPEPARAATLEPVPLPLPEASPAERRPGPAGWLARFGDPGLGTTAILVLLPLVLAGGGWAAISLDWVPTPEGDDYRLMALAIVLGGPATSLGAIIARIWWPRLVGLIVTCGLASLVIVARGLISMAIG